jgi:caffeoyl-CoA O-methyltransferase
MNAIVNSRIESYIESLDGRPDAVRAEMEALAERNGFPIVGPQVGGLLAILARHSSARKILELGSGFGYSAYWFAKGLAPGGVIHCTDLSAENRDTAERFFRKAGLSERIVFHVGDALETARGLSGPFDIVFNDIDKQDYPRSVDVALPLLRSGGLFITDNALWNGRVAGGGLQADATTSAIMRFNEIVSGRRDLETVILPVRDGIALCVKI